MKYNDYMKLKPHSPIRSASKEATRQAFLRAFLAQAPFDGWTQAAFDHAQKSLGLGTAQLDKLFPAGVSDIVTMFEETTESTVQHRLERERGFQRFRTRDKIAFAIRARLEYLLPHREAVRRLHYWYAMPTHVAQAVKQLSKVSDRIWVAAGDQSSDINYYTKRILLAAVLKVTLLFWLDDHSLNTKATWGFLDRRLGEVLRLGKTIGLIKEFRPSELAGFIRRKWARS